ncbi:hypothetical protein [Nonomuraea sp. CA-141351]|uniref:hypothetical protein n=1 Tax=Nonomuraea sp. CA-141351 TaxID=3239996 RepID=UPI003D8C773C
MFKRRLAVLGAAAVLAVTGLAGSALADETPATTGGTVTCKTADGKTITLPEIRGGKFFARAEKLKADKLKAVEPGDTVKIEALPDGETPPPGAVKVKPLPDGELPDLPDSGKAVPAQRAEPGDKGPVHVQPPAGAPKGAMKVKIICEKADQVTP